MWEMFNRSGFGALTNSGFPGEASGILRPYNKWRPIEQATMSYGHGISTSLMQLARAYTIFASGGELKPVSLLKQNMPVMGQRVISRDTAHGDEARCWKWPPNPAAPRHWRRSAAIAWPVKRERRIN
jgi:cell division protein FtsI (penicillin-binding protein 3)